MLWKSCHSCSTLMSRQCQMHLCRKRKGDGEQLQYLPNGTCSSVFLCADPLELCWVSACTVNSSFPHLDYALHNFPTCLSECRLLSSSLSILFFANVVAACHNTWWRTSNICIQSTSRPPGSYNRTWIDTCKPSVVYKVVMKCAVAGLLEQGGNKVRIYLSSWQVQFSTGLWLCCSPSASCFAWFSLNS